VKLLLVTRTQRPEGRVAQTRKTIEVDWVRVGRNASCEIHLPDARVALEQGMIVNRDGLVYLEGEAGSQDITRKSVRSVRMKPGEPIDVGPYRLEAIPAPEGYDGAVSVEKARDADVAPDFASRVSRTTLRSIGMTKRRAAWISIFVIAVLFFLVPAGRVLDLPWREAAMTLGIGDRFWNPGPLFTSVTSPQPMIPQRMVMGRKITGKGRRRNNAHVQLSTLNFQHSTGALSGHVHPQTAT